MNVVPLGAGNEAELEAFLVAHADGSSFLRENLRRGLVDRGEPLQGSWFAARGAGGEILAVASHNRKGNLMLQGAVDVVGDAARATVAESGRFVRSLFGPRALVVAARKALGFADRGAQLDSCEDLMALTLADLRVPPPGIGSDESWLTVLGGRKLDRAIFAAQASASGTRQRHGHGHGATFLISLNSLGRMSPDVQFARLALGTKKLELHSLFALRLKSEHRPYR